jgi:hypothetical protein
MGMPLKTVTLIDEKHAQRIWGYNFVLIRVDGHVAWRGQEAPDWDTVREILGVVTGQKEFPGYVPAPWRTANIPGLASSNSKVAAEDFLGVSEQV